MDMEMKVERKGTDRVRSANENILRFSKIEKGQPIKGIVAVGNSEIKMASNGKYLLLNLLDGESEIVAKYWSYPAGKSIPERNSVIEIMGTVGEWNGTKDISLTGWRNAPSDYAIGDFRKKGPNDARDMVRDIYAMVNEFCKEPEKQITLDLLNEYKDYLHIAPAAVGVHHNYEGGWAQHVNEVATIALSQAKSMQSCNPQFEVNISLVVAGAVLHDIGKMEAYGWDGIVPVMTKKGNFVDHLVLGCMMVPEHEELQHIIASHHGQKEWGSPVVPATVEALIVHMADNMSAKCTMFQVERDLGKPGFQDKKNWMFGTRLYFGGEPNGEK